VPLTTLEKASPLPDLGSLIADSEWVGGLPGLRAAAGRWQRTMPLVRRELEAEAVLLARPRLWTDTIGALAATGWKMIGAAAPDAPLALLSAAATAAGLPVAPPRAGAGTVARAQRLVRAGGPAYIKLGQFIASAEGLLPPAWVRAFGWCRDQAPPEDPRVAMAAMKRELGDAFAALRVVAPMPLAAGSIAQAHEATLEDGTEVIVKVRRPGLRERLCADIEAMALLAAVAERARPGLRVANLPGFVELFAQLVLQELDFRLEALNLVELGVVCEDAGIDQCSVPRPVPGMVTDAVLVMERLPGVPYDRAQTAFGSRLDSDRLLRLAIQSTLETTLIYGLFHGDMHAGNVLIDDGRRFGLIDLGICGRVSAGERAALVRFIVAFAEMDARRQLEALREFGAIPDSADLAALAADLQPEIDRLDPGRGNTLSFDQLGTTVAGLLRVLSAAHFRLPKELVLFFKNLLYLSGFTASVAPGADLLAEIQPILEHFAAKYPELLSAV
jgi:ubiquinone biosynthesis protein